MRNKTMVYFASVAVLVLVSVFAWNKTTRAGYESAEYEVIETDGKFEVREYPDLMLVSTSTKIDAQGRDGSFMKLFRYISGANDAEQKISMTTPVFMESDESQSEVQMAFVMPSEVSARGVPTPTGPDLDVRRRTGGRFAVLRFSGRLSAQLAKEKEAELRAWMETKGLVAADAVETVEAQSPKARDSKAPDSKAPDSAPPSTENSADQSAAVAVHSTAVEAASYDPPFTPGPLRRNEVLIRLK